MGILSWILLGLIACVLGKFLLPGKQPGGGIITFLLGIGGACFGGWVGSFFGIGTVGGFRLASVAPPARGGAILLLLILRMIRG